MRVIYFHGFASSSNSKKVELLKNAGFTVSSPNIPIDPILANEFLINFIKEEYITNGENDKKCCFVGTSLGGYWAARMGELFECDSILINPTMQPENSLKKYTGEYKNYYTGEHCFLTEETVKSYKNYSSSGSNRYRTYFLSKNENPINMEDGEGDLFFYDVLDHQGISFFDDVIKNIVEKSTSKHYKDDPSFF